MDWLTIALLAIVGILILALLITYSKKYAWVKVFTIVLVLVVCVGSATYCGIQLNFYYNASGGIFGYIEEVFKPNEVKVENMDFKITNIELTQESGTETYSARIQIDKTLDFEKEDNYGVFVNDIYYTNVVSNYTIVNYSYSFLGDNLEILLTDTLQINLAFNDNSTSLTLKTVGGDTAVKYWNYYFNKNDFIISIKACDFAFDQNIDYGEGYEENMQNQIKYYQSKIAEYENKVEELTKKLDDALEQGNVDKETIAQLREEIYNLNNQVTYYKELLEAYENSNKLIVTYMLVDNGLQSVYDVQVFEPNAYLSAVITPEGDFEGWTTEIGGEYIDDLTTIQVTENITIYGMFSNTVTFIVNNEEYITQKVSYNKYATDIEIKQVGYSFEGWALSNGGETVSVSEIPITKDTTFYTTLVSKQLNDLEECSWSGIDYFDGTDVWNGSEDVYYSNGSQQYVLNKDTRTWEEKIWYGLEGYIFDGSHVWTDSENFYFTASYLTGDDWHQVNANFILNEETSTWSPINMGELSIHSIANFRWTDGENFYVSNQDEQYIFNKESKVWIPKVWYGLEKFSNTGIWTDGKNVYYEDSYVLNKSNSTWNEIVLDTSQLRENFSLISGEILNYGENVYYLEQILIMDDFSFHAYLYIFNSDENKWQETKSWDYGSEQGIMYRLQTQNVWTDGENLYFSFGNSHYIFI